ncbi:MAG: flagellar FlbD family protein [Candidatus Riflebacteria bacterium]|nr:flagellar FlbD family protein [Candidatus Riflebacteria bacterium]
MIKLSRINGISFYLNAELIEQIESTPDTVITLHTGKTVMVADSVKQVLHRIICYKRRIHTHRIRKKNASGSVA